jgi:hypothetical protein
MSEREGKWKGNTSSLGGVQYSSEKKNEGTGREQYGNTAKPHGSMGGHSILLRAKMGGNEKGTRREREWNTETTWKRTWVAYNTCSLLAAFFFFWLNLASWLNIFGKWLKICVFWGFFSSP